MLEMQNYMANRMDSIDAPHVIGLNGSTWFAEAWFNYNLQVTLELIS